MHSRDFEISIRDLSKIEGHASLGLKVKDNKVKDVKLMIGENKRFFTRAVLGKPFNSVPSMVSRICGTCSIAHLTACNEAIEKALGAKPSKQSLLLRKLLLNGLMVRDHAMHLYLFVLPDVFGLDSVMELAEKNKALVHEAFHVKGAGNRLCTLIGGRAIHPVFSQIGGFSVIPKKEETSKTLKELKENREAVLNLIDLLLGWPEEFHRKTNFVAITNKDFNFLEGRIKTSSGLTIEEKDYWNHLHRVVLPYSQATAFEFESKDYMVGALARINLNKESLNKETRKDCGKALKEFPSTNVFHNNLAQAIEMLHCIDSSIELLEANEFRQEKIPPVKIKACKGVGVIEAPRGTLYYKVELDGKGIVKDANLVIPTAQNQINLQDDIRLLVQNNLDEGKPREFIQHEIEKLVRAYDPCMSCATHFLKINWHD